MNPSSRALLAGGLLLAGLARVGAAPASAGPTQPRAPRMVLATYACGYQGDGRKAAPQRLVRLANGATALTHHPWESDGPWFSACRAQWHKNQLQLMQGAGIDVALVLFRGSAADRRGLSVQGLDALAEALKEMRYETAAWGPRGREYPQIGLSLDLTSLAQQYGGPVDLKDPNAQRSLYGMIREFFMRVPEEFRAACPVGPRAGNATGDTAETGCIVRLTGSEALSDFDGSFMTYCDRRFAREFDARLVWIGTPDMRSRAPEMEAYAAAAPAGSPARMEAGSRALTASLGPGFENGLAAGDVSARSRQGGSTYIADWRAALEAQPDWVLLDSWNDFTRGTELAPSLEFGLQYRDLTRGATFQFKETPAALQYAGAVVRANLPRSLAPGTLCPVEALVKNEGSADWSAFSQVSLSYRWLKDGQPVGDIGPAVALSQARGEIRGVTFGLAPPLKDGRPLPAGTYELQLGLVKRQGTGEAWLDERASPSSHAAVQVGAALPLQPCWLGSDMPAAGRTGAAYRAAVRLRNDGSAPWKPEAGAALGFRWRRVSSYLKGFAEDRDEVVAEGPRVPLAEAVQPGRMATLHADVPLVDGQGRPLPAWSPAEPWSYVLEWDLWDGSQWASAAGAAPMREVVEALDRDPAPSFVGCSMPTELVAGRTEKVTVGLRNLGPETWKAGQDRVAVHWYYLDGTEAAWSDSSAPLGEDVPPYSEVKVPAPGHTPPAAARGRKGAASPPAVPETPAEETAVVRDAIVRDVPVRVPDYFGPMFCVFDLVRDGQPASTVPLNKGMDLLVIPVNVYSPTYLPLPLTPFFDTDGVSSDLNRADGNVDGRGNSLPAEGLPPYVTRPSVGSGASASPIYPCGLWARGLNQPDADRVTFLYPGKADRQLNMIACHGQRLPLASAPQAKAARAIHLLALSTEPEVTAEFHLQYADGTGDTRAVTFTHFTDPPRHGEHAAFVLAHRHTPKGDDLASRCYLNHYTLPADPHHSLTALELPRNTAVKVMAITIEASGSGGR